MSNPVEMPRFRYVVATPTREHGSALIDYDLKITNDAFHIALTPMRDVHDLELTAYGLGFRIWQADILGRGDPTVRRIGARTISYVQEFTVEEVFAFLIDETNDRRRFLSRRREAIDAGVRFLQSYAQEPNLVGLDEWVSIVAECLATSLPVLFIDELTHTTTRIALTTACGHAAWSDFWSLLRSPYVRDVANRSTPPLPATKEWTSLPAPVPIPLASYTYDNSDVESSLIRLHGHYRLSEHLWRLCRAAPLVHFISEETHYVLGSLVLAGNHLSLRDYDRRLQSAKGHEA